MNNNRVFTRYGSYYTAYPTLPPTSYAAAAVGNCNPNAKGQMVWTGIIKHENGHDVYASGFGKNCDEARKDFCGKYPCIGPGSKPSDLNDFKPSGKSSPVEEAVNSVRDKLTGGGGGSSSGGGGGGDSSAAPSDPGKNPISKCENCGDDWWNPGQWGCQLTKIGCEFGAAVSGTGNSLQEFFKDNIIFIGGGLVAVILLFKFIR